MGQLRVEERTGVAIKNRLLPIAPHTSYNFFPIIIFELNSKLTRYKPKMIHNLITSLIQVGLIFSHIMKRSHRSLYKWSFWTGFWETPNTLTVMRWWYPINEIHLRKKKKINWKRPKMKAKYSNEVSVITTALQSKLWVGTWQHYQWVSCKCPWLSLAEDVCYMQFPLFPTVSLFPLHYSRRVFFLLSKPSNMCKRS